MHGGGGGSGELLGPLQHVHIGYILPLFVLLEELVLCHFLKV